MSDLDQFNEGLAQRGHKPHTFEQGVWVVGTITGARWEQQKEYGTKRPMVWDDGKPRMQAVVTIQTELRDPTDAADDGQRDLYLKGGGPRSGLRSFQDAMAAAGAKGVEMGAKLAMRTTGKGEAQPGLNPPWEYEARYEVPAPKPEVAEIFATEPAEPF